MHARLPYPDANERGVGVALVVVLHVMVIAVLLAAAPVRRAVERTAPVVVRLIAAPVDAPPTEPPKPRPVDARPRSPRPVTAPPVPIPEVAVAHEAPAIAVAAAPPQPLAPAPAPEIAPPAPATAVTPPDFSAAYLDNPPPHYPLVARRAGEQGRVLLRVRVTPAGDPESVELKASSGSQRLDHAAIETVKRWRFVPARRGTEPVAAWVLVPIQFTLDT